MNTLRNIAGLVVLGSFIVACSTEAGGTPEEQQGSESAETSSTDTAKKDTKKTDTSKGTATTDTTAKTDDKTGLKVPGAPNVNIPGADGADGADGDGFPGDDLPGADGTDGADGADGTTISNGEISTNGGHVASNGDCCFQGQYFECPNANACFGGFDVNACIDGCGNDFNCVMDCTSKLSTAGGPKGCTQKTPPANVKCN